LKVADWSDIRSTLASWVSGITGLTCYWHRRPRPAHFGDNYAILDLTGRRTVGNDEIVTEYDDTQPAGREIRRYQIGQRQFTFPIQIRCQRTSDDVDAMHYTSLIRDAVCLPDTTEAALKTADISFARVLAETDLDYLLDNRNLTVAQLDLLLNASSIREDIPTGWVETLDDFKFYDVVDPDVPVLIWTGDIDVG